MLRRISRSRPVQAAAGRGLALYLRALRRTTRFELDPPDLYARIDPDMPIIAAMWHGQHFMTPFLIRPTDRATTLISRHGDGEINAQACAALGIETVRGSGGRAEQMHRKGGVAGLRGLLRALSQGRLVSMTADVPKVSRVAGLGIVTLARLSGRPIYPCAAVTARRIDFRSWDRASLGLPFGRGVLAMGAPIRVAKDADDAAMEAARRAVEEGLDAVHARAYALLNQDDPGRKGDAARPVRPAAIARAP